MGKGGISFLAALLVAGPALTTTQTQERRAPAGAVVVRPVQVREVRVDPQPSHRGVERPTFGVERPVDPFISRPVQHPQPNASAPRRGTRHGRINRGYGSVVGYPVIYPYAYPYDPFSPSSPSPSRSAALPNTYSNVASLPSGETITAAAPLSGAVDCEAAACGGLGFDITPASAQVWVDGLFVGDADEFAFPGSPLLLAPGDHYIEVRLAGYRTASVDVTVVAGDVTPYRGTLERLRLRRP